MKNWFVVYTQPGKEQIAIQHLTEQEFFIYIPCYRKERRHARKTDFISAPLFPRYLFIQFDLEKDRWRSINGTRGVSYLLMLDERPISISQEIVDTLKAKEDESGCVPMDSLSMFMQGEKVRILDGAFEGYTATFETLDDKSRVQLLLNFLGRNTKVMLPIQSIEAA